MAFRGTRLHIIAPWEVSDSTPVFSLLNPLQCLSTASIDAAFDFGLQCCASSALVVVFSPFVYSVPNVRKSFMRKMSTSTLADVIQLGKQYSLKLRVMKTYISLKCCLYKSLCFVLVSL